uniref:28 kDa Metastriate family member n=1 Tax=Rhipicephalus zambeziensis TaxID=60191 RepID=A0A224YBP4_9ACAR
MPTLDVVLLCFFVRSCIAEDSTTQDPRRHPALIWSDGKGKIGEGIKLQAHVFYDTRKYNRLSRGNVTEYFTKLFSLTQQHFNNNSVMITIDTRNITWNKTLEVKMKGKRRTLDGKATLKSLQNYSLVQNLPNNSIIYIYTNKTLDLKDYTGAAVPNGFSTLSTFGTFCNELGSAAIIVQPPGNAGYWSTVKATAEVFGSKNFVRFTKKDMQEMDKIFSRCHVHKSEESEESDEYEELPE